MDYNEYEEKYEKEKKKNEKYLEEFYKWLKEKGLVDKTINNHISNVEFYINDYLNYYEVTEMEEGCYGLDSYFGDWFIRKCMWSTPGTIKSTAASLKKFYLCMLEKGYIAKDSYDNLCEEIKEGMPEWIDRVEDYNNPDIDFDDLLF